MDIIQIRSLFEGVFIMKRMVIFIMISLLVCGGFYISKQNELKNEQEMLESISSKIIRFHVLANSDSKEDQELKLKVRDEVLKFISPKLKDCNDIEESRAVIKKYNKEIINISEKVIRKNGYKYGVKSNLAQENFPVKTYGNITLPQGEYEAYRILIGNAEGQNWWCLMFPPLCFADITKVEVDEQKAEKEMKTVLNDEEYDFINNKSGKSKIKVKSKIVEWIKSL